MQRRLQEADPITISLGGVGLHLVLETIFPLDTLNLSSPSIRSRFKEALLSLLLFPYHLIKDRFRGGLSKKRCWYRRKSFFSLPLLLALSVTDQLSSKSLSLMCFW
jgi:hypothetical protein